MVGRAGNAIARSTAALARVELSLHTVGAAIGEKNHKGLTRRGHRSSTSAADLSDQNQDRKLPLGRRGQVLLDFHEQLVADSRLVRLGRRRQDRSRARDKRENQDRSHEKATEHAPKVRRLAKGSLTEFARQDRSPRRSGSF